MVPELMVKHLEEALLDLMMENMSQISSPTMAKAQTTMLRPGPSLMEF